MTFSYLHLAEMLGLLAAVCGQVRRGSFADYQKNQSAVVARSPQFVR